MPADNEKIIDKIRKLLALATSSNEHEAALAAARAQDLLLKYNLERSEIENSVKEKPDPLTTVYDSVPTVPEWQVSLAGVVARANLCKMVINYDKRLIWFGRESNVEVAKFIQETLVRDLETIAASKWAIILSIRTLLDKNPDVPLQEIGDKIGLTWNDLHEIKNLHGKAWKNSFYWGAVTAIRERLQTTMKEFTSSTNNANALIVRSDSELTAYVRKQIGPLGSHHYNSGPSYGGAYNMGRQTGSTISFKNGIGAGGSAAPKRIGG